jgi:hypothetical protein
MNKRDIILLKKISDNQKSLVSVINEFKLATPDDLSKIHIMIRRGIVQTIADIFELTVPMSDDVVIQLPLNRIIIKQFRNTASHNYGSITNTLAYACMMHCIDKNFMNVVNDLILNDLT